MTHGPQTAPIVFESWLPFYLGSADSVAYGGAIHCSGTKWEPPPVQDLAGHLVELRQQEEAGGYWRWRVKRWHLRQKHGRKNAWDEAVRLARIAASRPLYQTPQEESYAKAVDFSAVLGLSACSRWFAGDAVGASVRWPVSYVTSHAALDSLSLSFRADGVFVVHRDAAEVAAGRWELEPDSVCVVGKGCSRLTASFLHDPQSHFFPGVARWRERTNLSWPPAVP